MGRTLRAGEVPSTLVNCEHSVECAGCPLIHLDYAQQLSTKRARVVTAMAHYPSLELLYTRPVTPAEPMETLRAFYQQCQPPGFWGPVAATFPEAQRSRHSGPGLLLDAALGIGACLGLVLVTNAIFVSKWTEIGYGLALFLGLGGWLLTRSLRSSKVQASA